MTSPARASLPLKAYWLALAIGFAVVIGLNFPGQLSFDSILQLYEGRTGHQVTFNPWIMSWTLGLTDRALPGAGLFVVLNSAALFATLAALPRLGRNPPTWLATGFLVLALLTPQVVNFQGIVWKDVVFANLACAGFVALGFGVRSTDKTRYPLLAGAVVLLALAGLFRQNGLLVAPVAALVVGLSSRPRLSRIKAAARGAVTLAAICLVALAVQTALRPQSSSVKNKSVGLTILRQYDIVGAVVRDPAFDLSRLPPANAAVIREEAPKAFSVERVDTFTPPIGRAMWQSPRQAFNDTWWGLVLQRPALYLRHRLAVFRQVLLTPDIARCGVSVTGVKGSADYAAKLGLADRAGGRERFLEAYADGFSHTPVLNHLTYGLAAAAGIVLLAMRRSSADLAMIGLMLSGLAFAASFFVISLACDYRYLYFTDLSAMVGWLYICLNPVGKGLRPSGAARRA